MKWSDETVEAVRASIARSLQNARIYNNMGEAYTPEAHAALAAVAQSKEVRDLVKAAKLVSQMEDMTEQNEYDALTLALKPFTEASDGK